MSFGIICEYNPFHNGHLSQINKIREISDEPIVCVMSGNFTQRGEVALTDKYTRAKSAVMCGADAVVELPMPFCISSAEYFARAGVDILYSLGVDKLCFGSESGGKEKILQIANVASSDEFKNACTALPKGEESAGAYFDLLAQMSGCDEIKSNDILGIEYAKAIITRNYNMEIYPIKREGTQYRENTLICGENPSASAVRKSIESSGIESIMDYVPHAVTEILEKSEMSDIKYASDALLLYLRLYRDRDIDLAVRDTGIINRVVSVAEQSSDYTEFERALQTKKYTSSSLRRAVLYMLLGIRERDLKANVEYTTLLAANGAGREILSQIRKKENSIPVITKPSSAPDGRQKELDRRADSFYTMCFENKKDKGFYVRKNPYIAE